MSYALQMRMYQLRAVSVGADLFDQVEHFDRWLFEPPEPVDREKAELLAALGVGPW